MKKKHMVCLIAFILLALIIPSNVQAKQKVNNVYQNKINYNINQNPIGILSENEKRVHNTKYIFCVDSVRRNALSVFLSDIHRRFYNQYPRI